MTMPTSELASVRASEMRSHRQCLSTSSWIFVRASEATVPTETVPLASKTRRDYRSRDTDFARTELGSENR